MGLGVGKDSCKTFMTLRDATQHENAKAIFIANPVIFLSKAYQ
jgi:hypothetical protein